jgi:VWFA-related protein
MIRQNKVVFSFLVFSFVSFVFAFAQEMPRFRAGSNLVRVDAYVSKDDVALLDLKADDFLLFEDDKPQQIENFQLVQARRPNPQSERRDPTNVREMNQQVEDAARVFTLFFDRLHVQVGGSYRARKPIVDTLDRLIGPDDMVGVMTPDMSPGSITYSRRTSSIEKAVTDTWHWGQRDRITDSSPEEQALQACYGAYPQIVDELIGRLREQRTLDALKALVDHLEVMRPERKFVMVFTEGWPLYRSNQALTASPDGRAPGPDPVGVDPRTGGLRRPGATDPKTGFPGSESCDRQRTMLAYIDHEVEFRELLQRANRANVSFYPIDARGLVVFDTPIQWGVPPSVDAAWLRNRYDNLRTMAEQTDGEAVLNTNDTGSAMQKVFADVGSYYLLSYYSTNQKLDGRFRRIRVEVKRDDAKVRARPGYLAPTEAEARAAGAAIERAGAAKNVPPPAVTRALDALAPARGNLPLRVQAIGGRNTVRAVVEIDPATAKQPEWASGGTLRLTIEPERTSGGSTAGASQTMTLPVEPGQRSIVINALERPLMAGRYSIRAEVTPRNGRIPLQVTTFATVPADAAQVGTGLLAFRRGPSTGLAYIATADPRYRRTERIRLEVPLASEGFTATGRVLTREGSPTAINVPFTTRVDDANKQQFGVADVTLAPLAPGEYVLELALVKDGKTEIVSYGFRIVP